MAERNQAKQESRKLDPFGNPRSERGDSDAEESEGGIQFGGDNSDGGGGDGTDSE